MREIHVDEITKAVRDMCISANKILPEDLCENIKNAREQEKNKLGKAIMDDICDNIDAAKELDIPICQDTGLTVVFAEIGQEVHLVGGDFEQAVNKGVSQGYTEGFLRCSVVADPIRRGNTGDNTPCVLHTKIVSGDKVFIKVSPKGFGSENMSKIKMFTPAASVEDIIEFVKQVAIEAGSNPCPPMMLGVGIGGDFEYSAVLAKKALCRDVSKPNADLFYAELEKKMLYEVNRTGIGPQGFGGDTTALAVNIETYPTHIAGLPVAVNVGCHVTRHTEIYI